MSQRTKLLIVIFCVVVGLVIYGQVFLQKKAVAPNAVKETRISYEIASITPAITQTQTADAITVSIDFGDGKKIIEESSGSNVYQALVEVGRKRNIAIESKEYKYGRRIEKIGEKANSSHSTWSYIVNGKQIMIAPDRYPIYKGAKIEFIYR